MAERIGQVGEGRTEGEEGMERREGGREREKKMSFFFKFACCKNSCWRPWIRVWS